MTDPSTWPDLASRALGGSVAWTSDDFFAGAENLISPIPATHDPVAFSARGKIYDGWETRRRREAGSDSAIVRLAVGAIVHRVVVDTAFFTGNYPPHASVEGTAVLGYPSAEELRAADWTPLVSKSELQGDVANVLTVHTPERLVTHVRLTIYPDGGVARLRVHGEPVPDPRLLGGRIDLAATLNGGRITGCSDMFYSSPAHVLAPGRAMVMSDGWENARRRDDGNDWITVTLGAPGRLHDVVIDTSRFVGNAPGWARLSDADSGVDLLGRTRLIPDTEQRFRIRGAGAVAAVRLDVYPDGGISRLRVSGEIEAEARREIARRWLSLLPDEVAAEVEPDEFFD